MHIYRYGHCVIFMGTTSPQWAKRSLWNIRYFKNFAKKKISFRYYPSKQYLLISWFYVFNWLLMHTYPLVGCLSIDNACFSSLVMKNKICCDFMLKWSKLPREMLNTIESRLFGQIPYSPEIYGYLSKWFSDKIESTSRK